jgi:hypothetical protein
LAFGAGTNLGQGFVEPGQGRGRGLPGNMPVKIGFGKGKVGLVHGVVKSSVKNTSDALSSNQPFAVSNQLCNTNDAHLLKTTQFYQKKCILPTNQ